MEADRLRLDKASSLLGLPLVQLGLGKDKVLDKGLEKGLEKGEDGVDQEGSDKKVKDSVRVSLDGWGFAGVTPVDRVGTAVRAAIRDIGSSFNTSAYSFARDASQILLNEIQT